MQETNLFDRRSTRDLSRDIRLSILRTHRTAGGGHLGSSLSIVEIMAVLFHRHIRPIQPEEKTWSGDRFVLSKGHAALALYCTLESTGQISAPQLATFGKNGSALEPHPNENLLPQVHVSTGSLGQGISAAVGLALGMRLRQTGGRTFVLIGAGEANEGQVWEAARSATMLGLSNLVVILDDNQMQQDGPTPDIMRMADLPASWSAMGWAVAECNGHACNAIETALDVLLATKGSMPKLLHARTVKGCGVDFLENRTESHYPPALSEEELALVQYRLQRF